MRIANAQVVITGAGSGIGAATAARCARMGATVIAVDVDGAAAEATAAACRALGARAHAYTCDVADAAAVAALAAGIEATHGPVEVLVNDAGVGVGGPFLANSLDDWEWLRGVNLDGVVHGCRAFGPAMVRRGHGHVVNIGSAAGYVPNRNLATYCATKAAVIMLSQCLRADWADSGVGVSVICPGLIRTPIAAHSRLVGTLAGARDLAERVFSHGHSPELVAEAIVKAVDKNQAVVPVGVGSKLAYYMLRATPGSVLTRVAGVQVPDRAPATPGAEG